MLLCFREMAERLDVCNRDEVSRLAICSYAFSLDDDRVSALCPCWDIRLLGAIERRHFDLSSKSCGDRVNWEALDPNVERPCSADEDF